jgi:hypothetical protein
MPTPEKATVSLQLSFPAISGCFIDLTGIPPHFP